MGVWKKATKSPVQAHAGEQSILRLEQLHDLGCWVRISDQSWAGEGVSEVFLTRFDLNTIPGPKSWKKWGSQASKKNELTERSPQPQKKTS